MQVVGVFHLACLATIVRWVMELLTDGYELRSDGTMAKADIYEGMQFVEFVFQPVHGLKARPCPFILILS